MRSPVGVRVLMLLENCSYPRDERVRHEARALVEAGYQVTIIAPRHKTQAWHETIEGVRVYRFPGPPNAHGFLGYLWEYGFSMLAIFVVSLFVFWRDGFDILHGHHPPDTFVFIALFFKLFGKRFVYDHHDLAPELYGARFRNKGRGQVYHLLVLLEKLSCRCADQVIATNQSYKQVEMERDHVPENRITIVRNGPDLGELYLTAPIPDLRQEGRTIIGYVGAIGIQDGVDYLVRALRHLKGDFGRNDFYCVIVGTGAALPGLQTLVKDLGLTDHVLFTGWVDGPAKVCHYLSSMDICVAPEPSDTYNDRSTAAKVMEYMALSRPVVSFALPEHRFTAQGAALYARPNDEVDLARQILVLMNDLPEQGRLGRMGRDRIENELAWSHQIKHLLHAYATLTMRTAHPGSDERRVAV